MLFDQGVRLTNNGTQSGTIVWDTSVISDLELTTIIVKTMLQCKVKLLSKQFHQLQILRQ